MLSFPIDTNRVDSIIISETTEQFHKRMEKQGFDISNCMCKDCRKFKGKNSESNLTSIRNKLNIIFLYPFILYLYSLSIYVDFSCLMNYYPNDSNM